MATLAPPIAGPSPWGASMIQWFAMTGISAPAIAVTPPQAVCMGRFPAMTGTCVHLMSATLQQAAPIHPSALRDRRANPTATAAPRWAPPASGQNAARACAEYILAPPDRRVAASILTMRVIRLTRSSVAMDFATRRLAYVAGRRASRASEYLALKPVVRRIATL